MQEGADYDKNTAKDLIRKTVFSLYPGHITFVKGTQNNGQDTPYPKVVYIMNHINRNIG